MASDVSANQHDVLYRVVLCGDSGVGKSCLRARYTNNTFTERHLATIGVEFTRFRPVEIEGSRVKLQICDLAGDERFRTTACIRLGAGVILVYDVTDKTSFDNLPDWLQRIDSCGRDRTRCVLIGNKNDMVTGRAVSYEKAKEFADSAGILYYVETSAKNAANVERAFLAVTSLLLGHQPPNGKNSM